MLVPLTESLYVSGRVHNKDRILVDIGTGYYAEVLTLPLSHQFCSLLLGPASVSTCVSSAHPNPVSSTQRQPRQPAHSRRLHD